MNTRETVLSRIRAALADVPAAEACHPHSVAAVTPVPGSVERFTERAAEYRAEVVRVPDDPGEIMGAIARACARHGARRLLVPEGLPGAWHSEQVELLPDSRGPRSTRHRGASQCLNRRGKNANCGRTVRKCATMRSASPNGSSLAAPAETQRSLAVFGAQLTGSRGHPMTRRAIPAELRSRQGGRAGGRRRG